MSNRIRALTMLRIFSMIIALMVFSSMAYRLQADGRLWVEVQKMYSIKWSRNKFIIELNEPSGEESHLDKPLSPPRANTPARRHY
jgi:hypothetical protein